MPHPPPTEKEAELRKSAEDLVADLGDLTLASIVDGGALDAVPILGTALKLWRGGRGIRDVLFERKLKAFLVAASTISEEDRVRFGERLEKDPDFRVKVGEHLVVVLDRLDDEEKATVLGRILAAYVQGRIQFDDFRRMSHILERAILSDLRALDEYIKRGRQLTRQEFDALESVGLVALQHSIIRKADPVEHQGRITFGGADVLFRVTGPASLFVSVAF